MAADKVTKIQTLGLIEFERRGQQFLEQLMNHFDGKNKATVLGYLVGEIEANIKEHSKAKAATLIFSPARDEFSLEDDGIGIGASFRQSGSNLDDQEALDLAIEGTSTKPGHRGYGLPTVIAVVNELKGKFEVASGNAGALIEDREWFRKPTLKHKGTKVTLHLPKILEISDEKFYTIIEGKV